MRTRRYIVMMKIWRLLLPVLVGHTIALAQSKVGTTAGQFLGISVGPRAISMGGAYVASMDDATSLYWNPGAFQQAGKSQFVFSNSEWLVGTTFRWFGFMYNFGNENAVGLSLTQLDYGEEDVTTVSQPEGTGERWSAQDIAIAASYCRRFTDRFSMGGSLKYVQQSIWNEAANTLAFDLGLLYITEFNDMRLGVSMSNFGGDLKLEGRDLLQRVDIDPTNSGSNKALVGSLKTDSWPLPLLFRVGVAMDVLKTNMVRITIAGDALRPSDNEESVNLGSEIAWNNLLSFRGGYKSVFGKDEQEGLSLGIGLRTKAEGWGDLEVNYAYTKFGFFGNLNSVSIAVSF